MTILVTGATGYIGARLLDTGILEGRDIIAASRHKPSQDVAWMHFDLNEHEHISIPSDVTSVIHLASDTSYNENNTESEIASARRLIQSANEAKARIIYISSQAADKDSPTVYGRTKWKIEQLVLASNGIVVRLGQVYGGIERGLFGAMVGIIRRHKFLPAFIPTPYIQPIHIDDCVAGILKLSDMHDAESRVYCLSSPGRISFTQFIHHISECWLHSRRLFVPIPAAWVLYLSKIIRHESSLSNDLNRLTSLFALPYMNSEKDITYLGITLRPLEVGMTRSGNLRRRRLIKEGYGLLSYVLKQRPSLVLVIRYVRMVESLRDGLPITAPGWVISNPMLLSILDNKTGINNTEKLELIWRIDSAAVIAEASKQGYRRYIQHKRMSNISATAGLVITLIKYLLLSVIGFALYPILIKLLTKREFKGA